MTKYTVTGRVYTSVNMTFDISDLPEDVRDLSPSDLEDYLLDKAYDDFGGISNYLGNGGSEKLVGVTGSNESLYCDDEVEFFDVEKDDND